MSITLERVDEVRGAPVQMSGSEMEKQYNVPVHVICSGVDANVNTYFDAAEVYLASQYPYGLAYNALNPYCVVVERQLVRTRFGTNIDGTGRTRICEAVIRYSTRSETRTQVLFKSAALGLETRFDRDGNELPTNEKAQVDYVSMHCFYRRLESGSHWAGSDAMGPKSSSGDHSMFRRVKYCAGKTNQIDFLGDDSDTWIFLGVDLQEGTNGQRLVTYEFAFKDLDFPNGEYERWGWRDSTDVYHDIVGRADFANILELDWPDADGGGRL